MGYTGGVPDDLSAPIPDASDADLAEQAAPVDPPSATLPAGASADPEAPEADRLEQAQEVPRTDDER